MPLSSAEINKLKRLIAIASKLIADNPKPQRGRPKGSTDVSTGTRKRRSGAELVQFRQMLKAERTKGVSAAELAKKHKVSLAYIYLL